MVTDSLRTIIQQAIAQAQAAQTLPDFGPLTIEIQRPKQAEHGDYSTNVALVAAAAIRKAGGQSNPRQIAQAIVEHLPVNGVIAAAELAGPGFVNLRLSDQWLQQQTLTILAASSDYGNSDQGHGQHWQVEYVSANPTGPIHFGGARNAVLGDSLANVLEAAGYKVQREFYINDSGTQFDLFTASVFARYAQLLGRDEPLPPNGYPGGYLLDYARQVIVTHGDKFLDMDRTLALAELRPIARTIVLDNLKNELMRIGVEFDNWFSEQSLYDDGSVEQALDYLDQKGELIRRDGAIWFLATRYPKNEKDEVVVRSNGLPTYLASDIAYHYDKFIRRKFDKVVNVWAVDHQGHRPRMAAVMQALGLDPERLVILMYELVKLVRDGVEVKLSKRAGNLLTIDDVVEEVGADALRFNLLTRSPESTIEFDLGLAVAQSNENPVYYVQYSHARICSILARAHEEGLDTTSTPDAAQCAALSLLTHPSELALLRTLIELEEQILLAVDKLSPHNLPYYALELARTFNGFYRDCRVVDRDQPELSMARLLVCRATRVVLAKVLALMRVTAPESM